MWCGVLPILDQKEFKVSSILVSRTGGESIISRSRNVAAAAESDVESGNVLLHQKLKFELRAICVLIVDS
jgi:hypothetical protein